MDARIRWAVVGVASAALVLSGCGVPPETVRYPAAVPTGPAAADAEATVDPQPEVEETATPTESATPTASKAAEATPTPKATRQAGPPIMKAGQTSDRIKELQARLDQVGWFAGSVSGYYGPQTTTAVAGFQAKRGLPDSGSVDQTTWDALVAMSRKPTAAELSNQPKATPTPTPSSSASGKPAASNVDQRCMTGRVICISKSTNKLRWMNDGNVVMTMDVRFGTDEYPTREGTFSVQWKSRDHVSTIYHTAMPYALFFSGGQAVHYSPDFAANGYSGGSHGCVNLRNKAGAESLFDQARVGDKVVVLR